MGILTGIESGFTKFIGFLSVVLTKTAAVDATFTKLAPGTKAAILATFYDVTKTAAMAGEAVADAEVGNFTGAVTLSQATAALVASVVADGKTDLTALQGIVAALKADL
jgi:hypothetical protein